ncbi:MAG: L-2-amino-thiazoline-4-carboxylic acid hydrolase [Candidatus Hodarchaeales archaeon]
MSSFSMDQMFDYFVVLTSKEIKKSFDPEEVKIILSSFTKRFRELLEKLKEGFNETELFHGINPIFVIALEESLPGKKKDKDQVARYVLAIYKMMLEEFILEPQRRFMLSSKDPWSTFIENTRSGNQKIYDNEYFKLKEVSSTDGEFAFDINRCIYQEIFKHFGRADLGPIMCEYDSLIAENVSKWVRFERKETIAEGFPKCTFRYFRIKQKFSDNPVIDNIYSFLKIIDDSDEMLSKQEIIDKGLEAETVLEDIVKLIEAIQNHPGVKTSISDEELIIGNVSSFRRHDEWKSLFNKKNPKEVRTKILRNLPLNLKEEKINQLLTNILENPYELVTIKWLCLSYLQHHFSSRVGFELEGIDETQLKFLLEEFTKGYSKISFESQSIQDELDNSTRVTIQAYGKGVPECKLKEPAQLLRRKLVNDYPDASVSAIKPILSTDNVAKKFFDIFENPKQPFQLRELALRILIGRVGTKLVPFLKTISESKKDDPFLRGRAIDTLSSYTSRLPQLYNKLEEFEALPIPVQRSIIDFVKRHGINKELLVGVAKNENITITIRRIALRNLEIYTGPEITDLLLESAKEKSNDELLRQSSLEALGRREDKSRIHKTVHNIFINPEESSFIRMEAFETIKELNYNTPEDSLQIDEPDWITTLGLKQLMEE